MRASGPLRSKTMSAQTLTCGVRPAPPCNGRRQAPRASPRAFRCHAAAAPAVGTSLRDRQARAFAPWCAQGSRRTPIRRPPTYSRPSTLAQVSPAPSSSKATEQVRVAVLGASGYTGEEVVRLLSQHPHFTITAMTGNREAGKVGVRRVEGYQGNTGWPTGGLRSCQCPGGGLLFGCAGPAFPVACAAPVHPLPPSHPPHRSSARCSPICAPRPPSRA